MTVDPESIRGGQLWAQDSFPNHVRFVTLTPGTDFVLLSDPRSEGSVICMEEDGKWTYTAKQLARKFTELGYSCKGQLCKLLTNSD